jgi:hypothetical protein
MPTTSVWLDDDYNIVDEDQATYLLEKVTDDQGRLVEERFIRIVRPDSIEADRMVIEQEAERLAAGTPGPDEGATSPWLWLAILVAVVVVIVILLIVLF